MSPRVRRPVAGLTAVVVLVAIFALAVTLFRGDLKDTVQVTVLSERAGLVMNPDAKVKMRGVEVGRVASIKDLPNGQAAIKLAMDPKQLHLIPDNVQVDIASTTVFGAKFVQLVAPAKPSAQTLAAGQTLTSDHVTVEVNTIFQQLTEVFGAIDPQKLNETLGAIAKAFNGRGEKIGQTLSDFDEFLAAIEPSLPNLSRDLEVTPEVINAYADAAPDLVKILDATSTISQATVDEQRNLDDFLVSVTGLAELGNDVVSSNRGALTDVIKLLVPTTDLLNEYSPALKCVFKSLSYFSKAPPLADPGVSVNTSFVLGIERYRYPKNLPKVAATGGPHCEDLGLPELPYEKHAPFLVADVGANPWQYGNQGILLNSDALKQALFGPLDGPPRNSAQVGQPG